MALKIDGLYKSFGENHVLRGVSLELSGGIYLLTGQSGCGKTTLLRILSGLEAADSGTFVYDGDISFMFQEARLFPWLNVIGNVSEISGCSHDSAIELLDRLGLGDEYKKYPDELSGGMQRRVSLARTLSRHAGLYLFDEPFSGLDAELRKTACEVIRDFIQRDSVAVIVSHETAEVKKIAERELKLEAGRIL